LHNIDIIQLIYNSYLIFLSVSLQDLGNNKNVPKNQRNAEPPLLPLDLASENTQSAIMNAIRNPINSMTFFFVYIVNKILVFFTEPNKLLSRSGYSSFAKIRLSRITFSTTRSKRDNTQFCMINSFRITSDGSLVTKV
jgi:hypothetical protein